MESLKAGFRKITQSKRNTLLFFAAILFIILAARFWIARRIDIETILDSAASGIFVFMIVDLMWHQYLVQKARRGKNINYYDFISKIERADRIVRIQSTFSYLFKCDLKDADRQKLSDDYWSKIRKKFTALANRNEDVRVEILLLDPHSVVAKHRGKERGDHIIKSLHRNIESLFIFMTKERELGLGRPVSNIIEVRIYNRLPGVQLHQVDFNISVSFYPPNEAASEQERIVYLEDSDPGDFHLKWFHDIWFDEKRTISINNYMVTKTCMLYLGSTPINIEMEYVITGTKRQYLIVTQRSKKIIADTLEKHGHTVGRSDLDLFLNEEFQEGNFKVSCENRPLLIREKISNIEYIPSATVEGHSQYNAICVNIKLKYQEMLEDELPAPSLITLESR